MRFDDDDDDQEDYYFIGDAYFFYEYQATQGYIIRETEKNSWAGHEISYGSCFFFLSRVSYSDIWSNKDSRELAEVIKGLDTLISFCSGWLDISLRDFLILNLRIVTVGRIGIQDNL